jgi:putative ATP-dependent endonuclease of OLD family
LKRVEIPFERDVTVFVGENDSGQTSIIDVLKVVFENKSVELDDFYYGTEKILIEIEIDKLAFILEFTKYEETTQSIIMVKLGNEYLRELKAELSSNNFNSLTEEEKKDKLVNYAGIIGVKFRGNIGAANLKERTLERIEDILSNKNRNVESSIPDKNVYFLDGKHFENISIFFRDMFFKEIRKEIWNEKIEEKSIEDIIVEKLEDYSETLRTEIEKKGIKDKLKEYLPELTEIIIRPIFEPQNVNIGVNVQFLEGKNEISIDKKGDGTKRRVTMALLEYEKSMQENEPSLFVFDEPDTHLHVRAQVELLNIIHQFCDDGKQTIIATHSPFIMNSVKPRQIRLLSLVNRETKIIPINSDKEVEWTLRSLGIENIHLFFSKSIVIVEGDTEEIFIPLVYEKLYGKNLHSNLVKVINRRGITDVPRFAEILSEFVKPGNVFILIDNDADPETEELIRELRIADENIFEVGDREFEDAFAPEIIHGAWKEFVEGKGKCVGENWTTENIGYLGERCIKERKKFSKELKSLNKSCLISMKKSRLAQALAEYCEKDDLPEVICSLLEKLQ